jgi:hypothetical protein
VPDWLCGLRPFIGRVSRGEVAHGLHSGFESGGERFATDRLDLFLQLAYSCFRHSLSPSLKAPPPLVFRG